VTNDFATKASSTRTQGRATMPSAPVARGGDVMLTIVIGLVLLAHGIGHSMGILGMTRVATVNPAWDGDSSWVVGRAGPTVSHLVGIVLWTASIVGFAALAGIVWGWLPEQWWAPLAIVSSLASLAGVVLFPLAFPTFSTIGAVAVDVAVLAATVWSGWVPSDLPA
jgi:hypothetical protein